MAVRETIRRNGAVGGVVAVAKDGTTHEFPPPITIDASGRDAFSISREGWKIRDPFLNKIAVWTYYRGALRDAGIDEGATTVAYVPERGWFWHIPLADNIVSVGVVAEKDYLMLHARSEGNFRSGSRAEQVGGKPPGGGRAVRPIPIMGEYCVPLAVLRSRRNCSRG